MIITATQRQIPVTPRKLRLLATAIAGLKPQKALDQLIHLNYSAALPLRKTIRQALANATHNHSLSPDTLIIKEIIVNQGLTYKRYHAAARGRGKPYTKRRSHLTIKLESFTPKPQPTAKPAVKKTVTPKSKTTAKPTSTKKTTAKQSPKVTKTKKL